MSGELSIARRFGRLVLPLEESTENNLDQLDPANAILLALFKAALDYELGPVWDSAVLSTPLRDSTPVKQALPTMPDLDAMRQVMAAYPLLCVTRGRRANAMTFDEYRLGVHRLTQLWDVDYILGPLEIGNELRLDAVLPAVVKILTLTVEQGGHMAYRTGTNGGLTYPLNVMTSVEDTVGLGSCAFDSIDVTEAAVGAAAFSQGGPKFHAASLTLRTTELALPLEGDDPHAGPFTGTTGAFGLTQSGDPSIIARTP